jgi:large subunit ribosomal protein L20
MPRATGGAARRRKTNRLLKRAKGFQLGGQQYKTAKTKLMKAGMYSFFGRKIKKRDYRSMWIVRINAACDLRGISYSRFMNGLRKANVTLNRKALAELALSDEKTFDSLVETAKKALA